MTSKERQAIARAIQGMTITAAPHTSESPGEFMRGAREQKNNIVESLCDYLETEDSGFKRNVFRVACGLPMRVGAGSL